MTHGRKAIDFSTCNTLLMFPTFTQIKKIVLLLFIALVLNLEHIFCKGPYKIFSNSYHMSVCYTFPSFQNPGINYTQF